MRSAPRPWAWFAYQARANSGSSYSLDGHSKTIQVEAWPQVVRGLDGALADGPGGSRHIYPQFPGGMDYSFIWYLPEECIYR